MKISKSLAVLGCITGFTLTSLGEIPFLQIGNNAEAITIPNFSPRSGFSNGMLTVEIPAALIQAGLSETLRANEGQIKSTEFQQIYLNNMRSTLISGGIRVSGNWTFKYRERIARNPFTGRWTHTPWGTEEGTFYQDFGVSLSNGRLIASTSARPSISSSSWYSIIIDEIIHHQEVRQNVRQRLDNELFNFNGLNLQAMLVQYGASTAASQLGVNQDQVASFINSNVGGINANFDSNRLAISLRIPSLQSISPNCGSNIEIRPTNQNLTFPRGTLWETCNGYMFIFQDDGNLVLYNRARQPLWASNTRSSNPPDILAIQTDGNMVLYKNGNPVWAVNPGVRSGAFLSIQTDGNVVLYDHSGAYWATGTNGG